MWRLKNLPPQILFPSAANTPPLAPGATTFVPSQTPLHQAPNLNTQGQKLGPPQKQQTEKQNLKEKPKTNAQDQAIKNLFLVDREQHVVISKTPQKFYPKEFQPKDKTKKKPKEDQEAEETVTVGFLHLWTELLS